MQLNMHLRNLAVLASLLIAAAADAEITGQQRAEAAGRGLLGSPAPRLVVKTIDGSLVCTRCSGKLEANSISGNMQLLHPTLDGVRVQTSSGNILFDGSFLSRGIYIMKNFSGTIEVHFSSNDSFDLNATSLKGDVINQAPSSFKPDTHGSPHPASKWGHSLFATMNDGHAKVELSSFSGTIKILKRD